MGIFDKVLLLTDLDGTLLDDERRIGNKTRAAVEWFQSEGGLFTAATGRLHRFFHPDREKLPLNAPAVVSNGCYLYDYELKKGYSMIYVPETAYAALRAVHEKFPDVCMEIHSFNDTYVIGWNDISKRHLEIMEIQPICINDPAESLEPWIKVLFTVPKEQASTLESFLRTNYPEYYYTFSTPNYFELMPPGVNKGDAALRLADLLGVNHKDLYCAGDHLNDISMIRVAALGFAPRNCHPEVRKVADRILPDNNHDAIAALIECLSEKYGEKGCFLKK
jgi:Cof subfamily protein (haloacid dehalogenase superfamily)